jgi:hypothetical protein
MRDKHIINLIEEKPLNDLSATEIAQINAHMTHCAECRLAFEAAIVSSRLLRERAEAIVEPAPFFQTRVLSAIRERSLSPEPFGFWTLWRVARVLVASMAASVMILAALTLSPNLRRPQSGGLNPASSAGVEGVFEDDDPDDGDMTYDQALTNLYDQEAAGANGRNQ